MSILKNKNTSQIVSIGSLGEWNGKDMRIEDVRGMGGRRGGKIYF